MICGELSTGDKDKAKRALANLDKFDNIEFNLGEFNIHYDQPHSFFTCKL